MSRDEGWRRRSSTRSLKAASQPDAAAKLLEIPGLKRASELLEGEGGEVYLMVMAVGSNLDKGRHFQTHLAKSEPLLGPELSALRPLLRLIKSDRNEFSHMITVGRSSNNDLILPFAQVSKLHAYFSSDSRGWFVRDCDSANGTKVNGSPLEPRVPTWLSDGMEIILGRVVALQFMTHKQLRKQAAHAEREADGELTRSRIKNRDGTS